jgi:DNA-binding ferritin-like protein (Dps family)
MEEVATTESSESVETPTQSTESSPESSESTETTEASGTETSPFDFNGWDGKQDSLPEDYRPVYDNINTRLETGSNELRNALQRDREIYQALLDGEDVNGTAQKELAEALKELESLKGNSSSWAEEKAAFEKQLSDLTGQVGDFQATEQQALDSWAKDFKEKHAEVLNNEEVKNNFIQLLDSGVDPDVGIELIQAPVEVANKAIEYMNNGVPGEYALRLAHSEGKKSEIVEPRPAAQLTAGATPATVPNSSEKSLTSNTFSIRDVRRLAAARAYKKRTG